MVLQGWNTRRIRTQDGHAWFDASRPDGGYRDPAHRGLLCQADPYRLLLEEWARMHEHAALAAMLEHDGIQRLLEYECDEDGPVFVLEHVDGVSLRRALEACGPLSAAAVAGLAAQLCATLQHLHIFSFAASQYHQAALSLDTVYLLASGRVICANPEICKLLGPRRISRHTPSPPAEIFDCLAPEQVRNHPLDARVDVYVVSYLILSAWAGRSPFLRPNYQTTEMLNDVRDGAFGDTWPTLPSAWERALRRGVHVDRAERFQTMAELAHELERAAAEDGTSAEHARDALSAYAIHAHALIRPMPLGPRWI